MNKKFINQIHFSLSDYHIEQSNVRAEFKNMTPEIMQSMIRSSLVYPEIECLFEFIKRNNIKADCWIEFYRLNNLQFVPLVDGQVLDLSRIFYNTES